MAFVAPVLTPIPSPPLACYRPALPERRPPSRALAQRRRVDSRQAACGTGPARRRHHRRNLPPPARHRRTGPRGDSPRSVRRTARAGPSALARREDDGLCSRSRGSIPAFYEAGRGRTRGSAHRGAAGVPSPARWSPDGSRMLFQADGAIYLVHALGGVPQRLIGPSQTARWVAYPAWSPDGRCSPTSKTGRSTSGPWTVGHLSWSPRVLPPTRWRGRPMVSGSHSFPVTRSSPTANRPGAVPPTSVTLPPAQSGSCQHAGDRQSRSPTRSRSTPARCGCPTPAASNSCRTGREAATSIGWTWPLRTAGRPPVRVTTGLNAHTFSLSRDGRGSLTPFSPTPGMSGHSTSPKANRLLAAALPFTKGTQVIEGMSLSPDGRWLAFDSDRKGNQDIYKVPGSAASRCSSPARRTTTSCQPGRATAARSLSTPTTRAPVGSGLSPPMGESRKRRRSPPNQRSPGLAPDGRTWSSPPMSRGNPSSTWLPGRADRRGAPRDSSPPTGAGRAAGHPMATRSCTAVRMGSGSLRRKGESPASSSESIPLRQPAPELAQWSPNSRTIYYKAFDPAGHSSLWSVPAAGGTPRILVRFDDPARPSTRPEFATDGKRFFFTLGSRQSDIWVMELKTGR